MTPRITPHANGLAVRFGYNAGTLAAFKAAVPGAARRWDNDEKVWLVDPAYGDKVADVLTAMTGQRVTVPLLRAVAPQVETRLLEVHYIGRCRQREGGESSATGWCDGSWSVVLTEKVLRSWFEGGIDAPETERPATTTYYARLGVTQRATDDEMKTAYRRLVKQWHPDTCHEPDAAQQFRAIQAAYEVLRDPRMRRKYDTGLAFERAAAMQTDLGASARAGGFGTLIGQGYRSPLRCGWLLAEGTPGVRGFVVATILSWQDIVNAGGQTLTTSWPAGADHFESRWV